MTDAPLSPAQERITSITFDPPLQAADMAFPWCNLRGFCRCQGKCIFRRSPLDLVSAPVPGDGNDGWIGVDLDGTLAVYGGWVNPENIGDPIPLMVNRVKAWVAGGVQVKIFTARVSDPSTSMRCEAAVRNWCLYELGFVLPVTNAKDYAMVALWDDRAVQIIPNTGVRADGKPD